MTTRQRAALLMLGLCLPLARPVRAEPLAGDRAVPAPLVPWVPWALAQSPERACPFTAGRALCLWPGRLELDLDARGGRFSQRVLVDAKQLFALPGNQTAWPLGVRVDGRELPVLDQEALPSVELAPGEHVIAGRFEWRALPDRLALPRATASIGLRVAGKPVAFPRRDDQGQLWVVGGAGGGEQGEQLELSVARKIEDGVPLDVITRIDLHVSGRARELSLGHVLLAGTVPLSVASELPARLESSGELRLQVRAGKYRVEIRARGEGPLNQLGYRRAIAAWPDDEVWVFQADEALRQVELSGAAAIDPARTELDPDWRALPAYVLHEGAALHLAVVRRGESSPPPNRVGLARELWLDLDGRGFTVRDHLGTTLRQGFRLDLLDGELGHVSAGAGVGAEDLLITRSADGKHAGVEVRAEQQQLVAEWRASHPPSQLSAVGWSEDVQMLATTLHLGPGFSLLGVRGADSVSESWLQNWDLFDFFFVLLIAIAAGRLAGRAAATLALLALVAAHGEPDAPTAIWFGLLGAIALLRVLPAGLFRNLTRVGFALVVGSLLLTTLSFSVDQVRRAIYPQLAQAWSGWAAKQRIVYEEAPPPPPQSPAAAGEAAKEAKTAPESASPEWLEESERAKQDVDSLSGLASRAVPRGAPARRTAPPQRALQQDPEATVQMGPGVPLWEWRSWELRWSGPVDKSHQLQLYLLTPFENRALSILRVLLLAGLLAVLLRSATPGRQKPERPGVTPTGTHAATVIASALLACAATLSIARPARADIPDPDLLIELRDRLTKPPGCRPSCASIDELLLDVGDAGLALTARVHAGDRTSVRLPGPAATWVPADVTLDGHPAPLLLHDDGFLHVRVEPGVHTVVARGPLPETDTLTLAFADHPHRARVQARGFKVDGVREDGRVEQAVQLSRMLAVELGKPLESAALPPWLLLERSIELGPSWEAHGKLTRISPLGTPIIVRVPLLPGELVTDSSLEQSGGELQVSLGRDQSTVEWSSRLTQSPALQLVASEGKPWSERFQITCGPIWHCELDGLTPTQRVQNGRYQLLLVPWPGERASLRVGRPAPAQGAAVAIDAADLDLTPGVRLQKASLTLTLRSSRGASERVSLPEGARVQSFTIDGRQWPMRIEGKDLAFTLEPGNHAINLQFQQALPLRAAIRGPQVSIQRGAANARITLHVPHDRWLLWASGPAWGPAILFWGYLVAVLVVAFLLARVPHSPLRAYQLALLVLGLTQVPAPAALCVVGWFFAIAYRERMPEQGRWLHNGIQLLLVLLTLGMLAVLYDAVHAGLLVNPDMQVAGAGSSGSELIWYADRIAGALPRPAVYSVPLWVWRLLMLSWALWLAASLVRWLPWAFSCARKGGLWKKRAPRPVPQAAPPPASPG